MSLILVADKNETRRQTLIEIIENIGNGNEGKVETGSPEDDCMQEDYQRFCNQCISYSDGSEAEEGMANPLAMFSIAILSTDLQPDGIELLRRMRHEGDEGLKSLPVIIASTEQTYRGKPIDEVARELNARAWDYKDINQLRAMVQEYCWEAAR